MISQWPPVLFCHYHHQPKLFDEYGGKNYVDLQASIFDTAHCILQASILVTIVMVYLVCHRSDKDEELQKKFPKAVLLLAWLVGRLFDTMPNFLRWQMCHSSSWSLTCFFTPSLSCIVNIVELATVLSGDHYHLHHLSHPLPHHW